MIINAAAVEAAHAAFVADPSQAEEFWACTRRFVNSCCRFVPASFREDLEADIIAAAFTTIHRIPAGCSFTRYLSGIVTKLRAKAFLNHVYERPALLFSEIAPADDDGELREFEPNGHLSDDANDLLKESRRAQLLAAAKLDTIREQLKPADQALLDGLRTGSTLAEFAEETGQSYGAVQRRFARFKEKLAKSV